MKCEWQRLRYLKNDLKFTLYFYPQGNVEFGDTWKIANYSQKTLKYGPGKKDQFAGLPRRLWMWLEVHFKLYDNRPQGLWSSLIHTITIALRYARAIINYYPQGDVKSDDTEVTNGVKWTSLYLNTEGSKKFINSHLIYYSFS